MLSERIERLRQQMLAHDVDLTLVGPGPDLRYLTGYHALPLERVTLLGVGVEGDPWLITPRLEVERAQACGVETLAEIVAWDETDDPFGLVVDRLRRAGQGQLTVAVQDRWWAGFLLRLQSRVDAQWRPASQLIRHLRMVKTADEIEALAAAAVSIDRVHAQVPHLLQPGRREIEVGREIRELILEDHDEVNFIIVASGPNGASPHHETGQRVLQTGDAIVVDIGGTRDGYCSDVTRNYALAPVDPAYQSMHRVLAEAQQAAVAHVRPSVTAASVDAIARDYLTDAGFGDAFIHRTGHGIGLEEHEEPWIVAGNDELLTSGMADRKSVV